MNYPYVCLDTETTGLSYKTDEIIEITAIEFDLSGKIGRKVHELCYPMSGFIAPGATRVNNITIDMVKNKPNYLKDGVREKIAKFIGSRTLIGHNLIDFDIKFTKITPRKMEDTLVMCRKEHAGRNNLKDACKRHGIQWIEEDAHRSSYDVLKTIELFCRLKKKEFDKELLNAQMPMFAELEKVPDNKLEKIGIIPSNDDKRMIATQSYSYSRITLYHQCPFKWYMSYIKKVKEPDKSYFTTGKICHSVAEWAGEACYRELFANKYHVYSKIKNIDIKIPNNYSDVGFYLYDHPEEIKKHFGIGRGALVNKIDKIISADSYEKPSMPSLEVYNELIENAIRRYKCDDPDIILEVKKIMSRFYRTKDFSLIPGEFTITEKRLAFDKDWNVLSDFYSNLAFFRGIIDIIEYLSNGDYIVITDYKSSRTMLTEKQLKEDRQMKIYLLLVYMFLPKGSFKKAILRIEYIRFGKAIEYEIDDIKASIDDTMKWINESIQNIEIEMLKTDGTAFPPRRNEYCHVCYLAEDGKCPLFNKQFINNIDNPFDFVVSTIEDCNDAWKRIEVNKAENSRLLSQCKAFAKTCSDPIIIDKTAKLDFYVEEKIECNAEEAVKAMLRRGVDINYIIKFLGITPSSLAVLCENKKIELTEEEANTICKRKRTSVFNAFTEEAAKNKKFLNS